MTWQNGIGKQLRGVAAKLTSNFDLQKDLSQEMLLHLLQVEAELPGRTRSWYIKSCEFRARNVLKRGRSVDSFKRSKNLVPLDHNDKDGAGNFCFCREAPDPIDLQSELITQDIIDLLARQLSDLQQQILLLLMHGFGVREIARELGVSHPTIVNHRKKIAPIAADLLRDSRSVGTGFVKPPVG